MPHGLRLNLTLIQCMRQRRLSCTIFRVYRKISTRQHALNQLDAMFLTLNQFTWAVSRFLSIHEQRLQFSPLSFQLPAQFTAMPISLVYMAHFCPCAEPASFRQTLLETPTFAPMSLFTLLDISYMRTSPASSVCLSSCQSQYRIATPGRYASAFAISPPRL
jgi:hypothetical protein